MSEDIHSPSVQAEESVGGPLSKWSLQTPTSVGLDQTSSEPSQPPGENRQNRSQRQLSSPFRRGVEWLVIVVVALLVAFLVKTFVFQAFYIPSGSMEPTLMIGDRILVDKLSYKIHPIHRFDIVVFTNPMKNDPAIKDLVKRVIGLPGDTIASNAQGQVLINGSVINEPFLPPNISMGPAIEKQVIGPGMMFVMGDNRGDSEDSRYFGQVPESSVVGRVVMRVWPLSRIHLF